MSNYTIEFNVEESDYEMLFKLKKRDRDKLIPRLFKAGYNFYFPNNNLNKSNSDLLSIVNSLKGDLISPDISLKIESLEESLSKLIGLGSNSSKKGAFAELLLEDMIKKRYGDIDFQDTSEKPKCGDAWLTFPDNKIVMLESKNYTSTISNDELSKMERDMIENNILWGIFVSWNSNLQGKREFDFHNFNHHGKKFFIVTLSNLAKDDSRLDLAIQVVRKLRNNIENSEKFPWLIDNISNDLDEFNEIVNLNYKLRDAFENTENEIKKNLANFYTILREYSFKLNNKAQQIIDKIQTTMTSSLSIDLDISKDLIIKYKDKKVLDILTLFLDNIKKINWILKEIDGQLNIYKIINSEETLIGKLKIQNKKILLTLVKFNMVIEFKEKEDNSNAINLLNDLNGLI